MLYIFLLKQQKYNKLPFRYKRSYNKKSKTWANFPDATAWDDHPVPYSKAAMLPQNKLAVG